MDKKMKRPSAQGEPDSFWRTQQLVRVATICIVAAIAVATFLFGMMLTNKPGLNGYYFSQGGGGLRNGDTYYLLGTAEDGKTVQGSRHTRKATEQSWSVSDVAGRIDPGGSIELSVTDDGSGVVSYDTGHLTLGGFAITSRDTRTGENVEVNFRRGIFEDIKQ
jgi:hypothetical protein